MAEVNTIILRALEVDFRALQSDAIKSVFATGAGTCPKCTGKLFPHEDGKQCFSCGLVVYGT